MLNLIPCIKRTSVQILPKQTQVDFLFQFFVIISVVITSGVGINWWMSCTSLLLAIFVETSTYSSAFKHNNGILRSSSRAEKEGPSNEFAFLSPTGFESRNLVIQERKHLLWITLYYRLTLQCVLSDFSDDFGMINRRYT